MAWVKWSKWIFYIVRLICSLLIDTNPILFGKQIECNGFRFRFCYVVRPNFYLHFIYWRVDYIWVVGTSMLHTWKEDREWASSWSSHRSFCSNITKGVFWRGACHKIYDLKNRLHPYPLKCICQMHSKLAGSHGEHSNPLYLLVTDVKFSFTTAFSK